MLCQTRHGDTFLHHAAMHRSADLMRFLLNVLPGELIPKLLVEVKDDSGLTPLHSAVRNGEHEDALIEAINYLKSAYSTESKL